MKVDVTDHNREQCLCPGCPTYNDCMRQGSLNQFCGVGKTGCDPESNGCLCGGCPVFTAYELTGGYYCLTGPAD